MGARSPVITFVNRKAPVLTLSIRKIPAQVEGVKEQRACLLNSQQSRTRVLKRQNLSNVALAASEAKQWQFTVLSRKDASLDKLILRPENLKN